MYSPAWPHGEIKEIFPNIFLVAGTNITEFNGVELQHSRNMIIVRDDNELSLINTVRLKEEGLVKLDSIGKVKNVIRIGAFHGRDDAFYLDRYQAKLWALKGMQHANHRLTDIELMPNGQMPFSHCELFSFETSVYPEGILHMTKHDGILITCDSVKNWLNPDEFFSDATAKLYEEQGFFGAASISDIWLQACQVKKTDFDRLQSLKFHHLLSAHGVPLLNEAYQYLQKNIKATY